MPYLFFGLIALIILLLSARAFIAANPAALATIIRRTVGALALVFAALLFVTGRWIFAVPVGIFGFGLLTGRRLSAAGFRNVGGLGGLGRSQKTAGRTSSVRTVFLDMMLDHDSGLMNGRVLAGHFDGSLLSDLSYQDLMALRDECRSDAQSLALLETYLDRVHPDWRAEWHDEETETSRNERAQTGGPMTRDEARAILGVDVGASERDIRQAHRQLMKRFHPDRGGSDYLAAKINEAKDILIEAL